MALYLTCGLCGRKQADGILSRGLWGHVEGTHGSLQACPTCKEANLNWQERLVAAASGSSGHAGGTAYRQ